MKLLNKMTSKIKGVFVNPTIEHINPLKKGSMIGAGVKKLEKEFVTHTTLKTHKSAVHTFVAWQKLFLASLVVFFSAGLILNWLVTLQVVVAILTVIYFVDVLFNFFLVVKSLHLPPELDFDETQLNKIVEKDLPVYTILCPMYKEAKIIPSFLEAISKLDWPKNKLDVQLLLEEDDIESINVAKNLGLPSYVRAIIVPHSQPKTKPKACNYGLNIAKGEYLVIYDAEDIPDPKQLKKAYLAFQTVDKNVICLQAKLNYFNPHQNFITRLFTAEYSLWFDVVLPGLQGINTNIPLGGTSNHFRISDLKSLEGWDPFNVTEDCDLGVRLFMEGKKTAVINSTTLEEANSKFKNWLRQRSRWIKGYMQTYLVHMRNPYQLVKKQGIHALYFNLVVGGKIAFMFINPFLWLATIAYFVLYAQLGSVIESLFPSYIFYMALFSLVFGNFLYMFYYMIGCAKRDHWSVIKYVYLVPFYWIMTSIAAVIALQQLFFKPHYWEKTVHGLHLKKETEQVVESIVVITPDPVVLGNSFAFWQILNIRGIKKLMSNKIVLGGSIMLLADIITNLANFVYNTVLGRKLSFEEFGVISLFSSIYLLAYIPIYAISSEITRHSAYLLGKSGSKGKAFSYLSSLTRYSIILAVVATLAWVGLIPFMSKFFNVHDIEPFILFAPTWIFGIAAANAAGYLKGILSFPIVGGMLLVESLTKLGLAMVLVWSGNSHLVYLVIPVSILLAFMFGYVFIFRTKSEALTENEAKFNYKFSIATSLNSFANISFLGFDVLLAKHYLSPLEAGQYAVLSLVGKIAYFAGSLFFPYVIPVISHNLGAEKSNKNAFMFLFGITAISLIGVFIFLGIFGNVLVPILFGEKTNVILKFLPIYVLTIVAFTITRPIINFFLAKERYLFSYLGIFSVASQIIFVWFLHDNLSEFVLSMFFTAIASTAILIFMFIFHDEIISIKENLKDLFQLFTSKIKIKRNKASFGKRILIFNWRDTKHVWAGGAENYIHEIAKRWVKQGYSVTVFAGNDGKSDRHDLIDGVNIVRRGGFYTVYVWAFIYYFIRFRKYTDIIVDSENGLPFFTPIYSRKKKYLLIHHIHQDVFRQHLSFPFSTIARFLEGKLMPLVYHNQQVITVSESSKLEIDHFMPNSFSSIQIVNPGINFVKSNVSTKTNDPTIVYVGRLKPYKNIDVAVKAFIKIVEIYPNAVFKIAGTGESFDDLTKLVTELGLQKNVKLLGFVTENQKANLLSESWVMVQPSMVEGWGITVIEANRYGTPVVASDVNGLKDSVVNGKTGYLVPVNDSDQLAEKIIQLIKNKRSLLSFSKNAKEWSGNFSWDISAERFLNIISESKKDNQSNKLELITIN